ncbi:MAG: hypothetical protein HQL82_08855 [Magnetococcales bacterium]|nr:hypothetical protein [Magnetococcales bacterium]
MMREELTALIEALRRTVTEYDRLKAEPLLLSDLGNMVRTELSQLRRFLPTVKLQDIILTHLGDSLCVVPDPSHSPRIFIAPATKRAETKAFMESHPPEQAKLLPPNMAIPFDGNRVQRAVLRAFQKPLDPGKRRYLSLNPPFRYHEDREGEPEVDDRAFTYIDRCFIATEKEAAGRPFIDPSEDAQAIERFKHWLEEKGLPYTRFVFLSSVAPRDPKPVANPLLELIDAQPEDIRDRLLIPASVIRHLLKS